jgi:hypothetical protein
LLGWLYSLRFRDLSAVPEWFFTNITMQKKDWRTLVLRFAMPRDLGWSNGSPLEQSFFTGGRQ